MQTEGVKMVHHNCGKIEVFLPYEVDVIGSDGVQIQSDINDIPSVLKQYGDRLAVFFTPNMDVVYDPKTTVEQGRAYAREVVDTLGAASNPGSGIIYAATALREDVYYAIDDEMYAYSLEKSGV